MYFMEGRDHRAADHAFFRAVSNFDAIVPYGLGTVTHPVTAGSAASTTKLSNTDTR
jgi:hypothetical protein